jgi:hypothetical protein
MKNLSFGLNIYSQIRPLRAVGRGGAGSLFISPVWGEAVREGEEAEGQDYREKPDYSHMVSDRASDYFVTGENDINPV